LNPDLAAAWEAAGSAHLERMEWADAIYNAERALRAQPGSAGIQFGVGFLYTIFGWFGDSIAVLERAAELDPRNAVTWSVLGRAYLSAGRIDDAFAALEQSMAVGYSAAHINLFMVHLTTGDADRAKSTILEFVSNDADFRSYLRSFGMEPADFIEKMVDGYFDRSLREEYLELLPETETRGMLVTGSMLLKNSEHLVRWLQESTYNSYLIITYLMAPPFRDMLNQPAMKDYFHSTGLPAFWRANKWPDFCRPVGDDDFECQDINGNYP
jgi:tetratricopeptide (TPR) repeat protein